MGGAEREPADRAENPDSSESGLAADGLGKTCFGRRLIIDPAARRLVDVGGNTVNHTVDIGALGLDGMLGAPSAAVNLGRKILGGEARPD